MNKSITKIQLVKKIYGKLDYTIPRKHIYDMVNIICDYVVDELLHDRNVSIDNFGTFSLSWFHGHKAYDPNTGTLQFIDPFKIVKFRSHTNLDLLLSRKLHNFKCSERTIRRHKDFKEKRSR